MSTPKLRFKGFENEWKSYKLENLISTLKSGLSRQLNNYDIGIPVLRANNIQNGNLDFNDIKYWYIDDPQGANTQNYLVQAGDILINFINSEAKMGTTAFVKKPLSRDMIYTTNILRMTTNEKLVNYFFHLYSQTHKYKNYIKVITKPAVNQASFTTVDFKAMDLTVPHIEEQQKIVDFFILLDQRIEKQHEKVELLKEQKKGLMQKIFSQELRFKDDDGKNFLEWHTLNLGKVVEFARNGLSIEQNIYQRGKKVTRIETISKGKIDIEKIGYVDTPSDISDYKLRIGDILFSNINSVSHIGKVSYVEKDHNIYHGMNLLCIRANHKIYSKFLFYLLSFSTYRNYFKRICNKAVNQASINQTELLKTKIHIPSLSEQKKIADFLFSFDHKIEKEKEKLEVLQEQKTGFMKQMFI